MTTRSKSNATSCREAAPYRFELRAARLPALFARSAAACSSSRRVPELRRSRNPGRGGQARRADRAICARGCTSTNAGTSPRYTGKTEIGQNIRTSLAQAIADELRVPLTSVTMVMADTDLTPYDAGHVRIADDAADGAAVGAGRRDRARDADRPRGGALAGRPRRR